MITLTLGCSAGPPGSPLARQTSRIVGGGDDNVRKAVVNIGNCTGTFITRNLVLTAGHCLDPCTTEKPTGCKCMGATTTPNCVGKPEKSFVSGPIEEEARDGDVGYDPTSNRYPLRYVLAANPSIPGYADPVDAVIMVSRREFEHTPIPVAPRTSIITPGNATTFYDSEAIVVGYSGNGVPTAGRRRWAAMKITGHNTASFIMNENGSSGTCPGDSGGAVIEAYGTVEHIIGVMSQAQCSADDPPVVGNTDAAFVPYEFLDALCPHGGSSQWENCGADMDRDGVVDYNDNCPLIANANQSNCNPGDDTAIWGKPMGDACDPSPCARGAGSAVGLKPSVTKSHGWTRLERQDSVDRGRSEPFAWVGTS